MKPLILKPNDNRVFVPASVNMTDVSEPEHNLVEVAPVSGEMISERDFVLLLISLYRDNPVLWKVNNSGYTAKRKRTIALQRITRTLQAYKLNYTKIELKKKINSLRTNFNKEKKQNRYSETFCHFSGRRSRADAMVIQRNDVFM